MLLSKGWCWLSLNELALTYALRSQFFIPVFSLICHAFLDVFMNYLSPKLHGFVGSITVSREFPSRLTYVHLEKLFGSRVDFRIKLYEFQHYLAGQDHFVGADPPVRKVKEVKVRNHKIPFSFYCLHLWSKLLVAVACDCFSQWLFGHYDVVFFLEFFSRWTPVLLALQPWCTVLNIPSQFTTQSTYVSSKHTSVAGAENIQYWTHCTTRVICVIIFLKHLFK